MTEFTCAEGFHVYDASKAVECDELPDGIRQVPCKKCGHIGYLAGFNHPNIRIDKPKAFVKWVAKD